MKNILLLVHDDPGQEARVQAALDLTRALDGHLTCLDVAAMPVISGDIYSATVEVQLLTDQRNRAAQNRDRLKARLTGEDVPWNWVEAAGQIAPSLAEAAKMADLIVLSRRLDSPSEHDMRAIAGQVVIASDRAVVAVPEHSRGFDPAGVALIAWNGSDEAMKAVQEAVPLLQLARNVTIVEIDHGNVETPAEDAATYLSRHGIRPVVVRRRGGDEPVGDTLLAEAKAADAAYIVMGGFRHSRMIEALFGGVSREMLGASPVPVIMAH